MAIAHRDRRAGHGQFHGTAKAFPDIDVFVGHLSTSQVGR